VSFAAITLCVTSQRVFVVVVDVVVVVVVVVVVDFDFVIESVRKIWIQRRISKIQMVTYGHRKLYDGVVKIQFTGSYSVRLH